MQIIKYMTMLIHFHVIYYNKRNHLHTKDDT